MADTIFAQATARGRAGVAIIRVSGPAAYPAVAALTKSAIPARKASLQRLYGRVAGDVIDEVLILFFPGPASFTGENIVEIQCHGSPAVCRRIQVELASLEGLRLAQPGEFTRRALENGRLDLTQVEGLADLLAAETEAQRRQAVATATGSLSRATQEWAERLTECLAFLEAIIDFGDDVPVEAASSVPARVTDVVTEIETYLAGFAASERIREGFTVAICGSPNAGKSTLLNLIAGRDVALTSEVPGTTRDVLEVQLDLQGYAVTLLDTAGIREAEEAIERLGIERALARAEAADLRLFLIAPGETDVFETQMQEGDVLVYGKADLLTCPGRLNVSGLTGQGVQELLERIGSELESRTVGACGMAHSRQRDAILLAQRSLEQCLIHLSLDSVEVELACFELRAALRSLDILTGRVDVEAMLDHVFRSFCLGK